MNAAVSKERLEIQGSLYLKEMRGSKENNLVNQELLYMTGAHWFVSL